jgi:hypothetical protein
LDDSPQFFFYLFQTEYPVLFQSGFVHYLMQSIHNRTRNKKNKKNTTTSEIPGKPLNQNKAVSAQENMRSIVLKQNLTTTGKTKDPR